MGTMTRLEIATEVLANLDNRQDVLAATMARWINHTYMHMTHPGVHVFEDLNTTYDLPLFSGTSEYSLAASALGYRVLAIRGATYYNAASGSINVQTTRSQRLKPKPVEWYDNRIHPAGEPRHYVPREGQNIILSLTPNSANTIRLRLSREAAALDTCGDAAVSSIKTSAGAEAAGEAATAVEDGEDILDHILHRVEKREILGALRRSRGQRSRAARTLGISRSRLYRSMEALGIDPRVDV